MDPITMAIVSALAAGIGAGVPKVAEQAIVDGYNTLRSALKERFGEDSDVVEAVEKLEAKPNSTGRQTTLHEEIKDSKADQDPDLIIAAEALVAKIKDLPGGQTIVTQVVEGDSNVFSGTGDVTVTGREQE